jgi:DNA-binding transcriptional LysR family regulator
VDVKTLYTLVAIADRGSFAEAGNAIGLSLSAVSMQMRALEDELGFVLFDRSRRPPLLTDEGLNFTQQARDLILHWESLSGTRKRGMGGGVLKLGAVHTAVSGILPLALKRLRDRNAAIEIQLTTGLTHDLEAAVHRGQLDVAVVSEPEVPRLEVEFTPFITENLVVIAHASAEGATDSEILENTPYVRFNRLARVGHLIQDEILRRNLRVRAVMEIDTLEGVVAMVASGLGSSIVPARGTASEFPPSIRTVPFGKPPLTRRLGLLVPKGNPRTHLSQMLLEALSAVAQPEPARPKPRRAAMTR